MKLLLLVVLSLTSSGLASQSEGPAKTLLLLVEGTSAKVSVTSAWRKDLPFAASLVHESPRGWARVLDAQGRVLARIPLDLSKFHLDANDPNPRVVGDQVFEPGFHQLVKIPDMGVAFARVEFVRTDDRATVHMGSVSAGEIHRLVTTSTTPLGAVTVKTHINNGPPANRYDIVILADGYLTADQTRFYSDVTGWTNNLFAKEPFKTYRTFFNVHSVFRASAQRGADNPRANPPIYVNTVYDSTYWYGGTERCLYIKNTTQANRDAALAPDVETSIAVFVNSSKYGGCGGRFAVSYNGSSAAEVQSHEFGHSYGGLADEYGGNSSVYTGPEPREPNVTKDPNCAKWSLWKGFNGVGCYEGGRYYNRGIYRPKSNCLMRSLSIPLCPVCIEELAKDGYTKVNPIEKPSPSSTTVTVTKPNNQTFSFANLVPAASNPLLRWYVDNVLRQTGGTSFVFASASYTTGNHALRLEVLDRTAMIRKDPTLKLRRTHAWTVTVKDSAGTYTVYGVSCGAAPVLGHVGVPSLGRLFSITLSRARPSAVALIWLGRRTAVALPPSLAPGCWLYATPDVLITAKVVSSSGNASLSLLVPNLRGLIGVKFSNKWNVFDAVNPLGIIFTNGGEGTIGG